MDKWALLIGVNEYYYLSNLKYSAHDVSNLKEAFCDLLEFPEDHITVLSDESENKPSRANIFNELGFIHEKNNINPDDLFVFYFTGHGLTYEDDGKDYLLPCDASKSALQHTAMKIEDVVFYLKKTGCNNLVMFIDAYREIVTGAKAARTKSIGKDSKTVLLDREGIVAFFSCDPKDLSCEIDELRHGSFAYNVLAAIKSPNCSTVEDMDNFLRNNVPLTNEKYGKPPQRPYSVVSSVQKLKQPYFVNHIQLEKMNEKIDNLLFMLGDRYVDGLLESDIFNWAAGILSDAKTGFRDERHEKMCRLIEDFIIGNISQVSLKAALEAVRRRSTVQLEIKTKRRPLNET
jgi:uncharacterized caspase-like protein